MTATPPAPDSPWERLRQAVQALRDVQRRRSLETAAPYKSRPGSRNGSHPA
jgi:hypothetical protein